MAKARNPTLKWCQALLSFGGGREQRPVALAFCDSLVEHLPGHRAGATAGSVEHTANGGRRMSRSHDGFHVKGIYKGLSKWKGIPRI